MSLMALTGGLLGRSNSVANRAKRTLPRHRERVHTTQMTQLRHRPPEFAVTHNAIPHECGRVVILGLREP
jgi:hypothetical protein